MADTVETEPEGRSRVAGVMEERLEFIVALLLGLAAVATAWAAFQASQFDGEVVRNYTDANLDLSDANTLYNEGTQLAIQDELLFLQYATAIQNEDPDLALYIRESLMRDELVAALEWWEQQPDDGPDTPFVDENPSYLVTEYDQADTLIEDVNESYEAGQKANETGDKYNLIAVLLAASLFVLGIAGSFKVLTMRLIAIAVGALLFAGSTLWMLTLPTAG